MENKVYVVEFLDDEHDENHQNMKYIFNSMEDAKKYIVSKVEKLNASNIQIQKDSDNYYKMTFINTFYKGLHGKIVRTTIERRAIAYECDINTIK